jgi:hypothetical protein
MLWLLMFGVERTDGRSRPAHRLDAIAAPVSRSGFDGDRLV